MARILSALCFLLCTNAYAEVLCVYASASSECNGLGATTTFNGWSSVLFANSNTSGQVDAGDTLYVTGTYTDTPLAISTTWTAGTASERVTIECVGCVVDARHTMTEATTGGNWTDAGSNNWYLDVSSYTHKNPRRVWRNGTELFPAQALANLGTAYNSGTPVGMWFYDSGTDRLYLYSTSNPAGSITSLVSLVAGSDTCSYTGICVTNDNNDYIDFVNFTVQGGNLGSIYMNGGDNNRIYGEAVDDSDCNLGGYSFRAILFTDSSTAGTGNAGVGNSVQDCTIDALVPDGFDDYRWQWASSGIAFDGIYIGYAQDISVVSNTIRDFGHAMLEVVATSGAATINSTGHIIRNNYMECTTGVSYCRGFAIDGLVAGDASDIQIGPGNTFTGMNIRNQLNGDKNIVTGNIFKNARDANVVTDDRATFIQLQGYAGVSQDNVITNNVFYNNAYNPCISFAANGFGNTVQRNQVLNNILYDCGGTNMSETGGSNTALYLQNDAEVGSQIIRSNTIFASGASPVYYKASGAVSVSSFQSACSGDVCLGNLTTDPAFTDASNGNFTPGAAMLDAGTHSFYCTAFDSGTCLGVPDIGAYQNQSVQYGYTLKPKARR